MPLQLRSRFISLTIRHAFAASRTASSLTSSTAAKTYYAQLYKKDGNLEISLSRLGSKLDASCVIEVLNRCSPDHSLLGLRFFVWAGLRSDYRHSPYIYTKAGKVLKMKDNPQVIHDVLEAYKREGCAVGVRTFRVVLNLCKETKLADESFWVLRKMVDFGCHPDTVMYNVVLRLFCEVGRLDEVGELVEEMDTVGICPDMITYSLMIKAYCDAERIEDACGLFKVMKERGCRPNVAAYSQLLDGVCKYGSLKRALELLEGMENEDGDCKPNVMTYTSVIQAFCERGRSVEALTILDRMVSFGCPPNRVTAIVFNKRFCEEGLLEQAYKVTERIIDVGTASARECFSSLVVSLLQAGHVEEAEKEFRRMLSAGLKPDGLACSVMVKQMCLEDRELDSFDLLQDIDKIELPSTIDSDICCGLLGRLCQKNHVEEAAELAKLMIEKGVQPKGLLTDGTMERLKKFGYSDLVTQLTSLGKPENCGSAV
uniref:Pentatricopeptide repeat-containing protein n=1 Tax=Kalanchoe fedtschenkoi TaxID=63787 RepID=A0A7N0VGS8_KALFE